MTATRRLCHGAAMALVFLALGVGPAAAEAKRAGSAVIVDRSGEPLDGGGSATEFRFELASPAECPGDSQNGNYRYHTFMIPAEQEPDEISYNGLGPDPQRYDRYESFRMPLFDENTADVTAGLTAEADELGGPGSIVNLPVLSFHVYRQGDMPLGRYRIGVVCTHLTDPERYWDAVIEVSADEADELAGIRWDVEGAAATPAGSSFSIPLWVGVGAAVALVVALLARTRQKDRQPMESR